MSLDNPDNSNHDTPEQILSRLQAAAGTATDRTPDEVAAELRTISASLETLADRLERFVTIAGGTSP